MQFSLRRSALPSHNSSSSPAEGLQIRLRDYLNSLKPDTIQPRPWDGEGVLVLPRHDSGCSLSHFHYPSNTLAWYGRCYSLFTGFHDHWKCAQFSVRHFPPLEVVLDWGDISVPITIVHPPLCAHGAIIEQVGLLRLPPASGTDKKNLHVLAQAFSGVATVVIENDERNRERRYILPSCPAQMLSIGGSVV